MSALGLKVRELREARGWTQLELALLVDMSMTAIRAIETRDSNPNLDTLRKLTSVFDVGYDELINESDPKAVRAGLEKQIKAAGVEAARGSEAALVEQKRLIRQLARLEGEQRTSRVQRAQGQGQLFEPSARRTGGGKRRR
jgi:transcriptional regulator with XRE-family HTH domain